MPKMSINKRQLKWVQITLWCCPQLPASRHAFFFINSQSCRLRKLRHTQFLFFFFLFAQNWWPHDLSSTKKMWGRGVEVRENENENNVQSSEGQRQGIVWPLFGTWVKMSLSIYLGKFFKVNACLSTAARTVGRAARPLLSLLLQP